MRQLAIIFPLLVGIPAEAGGALRYPDPDIEVPMRVADFIVSECREFRGHSAKAFNTCVSAETLAYQATVEMLTDPDIGEKAAAHYRQCQGGPGRLDGQFHRRQAECIGSPLGIAWRFEPTQKAALRAKSPTSAQAQELLRAI